MKTRMTALASTRMFFPELPGMPRVAYDKDDGAGAGGDANETNAAAEAAAAEETAARELAEAEAAAEAAAEALAAGSDTSKDGKEKAALLREVMDKKSKLKDAEKRATDAAAALAAYGGVDPQKVRDLIKREEEAERAAAEAKGDFDRVKAMMIEEHNKEKSTLQSELEAERAARAVDQKRIDDLTVGNDFGNSKFIQENLTLTPAKSRKLYGAHFEVVDGRTVGYDKPAGAKDRTMLVNAKGDPLGFDEAFKRIIDADPEKETLLKAKISPGAGSRSENLLKTPAKKSADNLFGMARLRAALDNDVD
ncbi:hypothetical protein SAMN05660859_0071 [Ancylobacter rudongensis]|uniref:DUF6651 domain-containing protein n=2 Tax=Ancylobacter rudongensis TaxID=177413 RepID=A0A1G4UPR4_9HYPH|nr:hypothetical protein SAMN05660859_0071 [Ancylobacter rudongensis]